MPLAEASLALIRETPSLPLRMMSSTVFAQREHRMTSTEAL
jgi:hypothetical protein